LNRPWSARSQGARAHTAKYNQLIRDGASKPKRRCDEQAVPFDCNTYAPMTFFLIGQSYKQLKRPKEAIAAYKQAIHLRPDLALARYQLGLAYLEIGDRFAAREQAEELVKLDSKLAKQLYEGLK
jgi:tetratricopeptide (TPR) repeat protein